MIPTTSRCLPLLGVLLVAGVGCPGRAPDVNRSSSEGRSAQRNASQANVLLDAIASQLRSLPEAAQLELRPPTVLLDSRRSGDGNDIEAVLSRPPGAAPDAPANVLLVPTGNARFRSAGVRPGDTIKYFVIPDRDTMDRLRASGEVDIVTFTAANLTVAQVLSDDSLLVVGGLAQEIVAPAKIEVWRTNDDRMEEISSRLGRYTERRDPPRAWQPAADEAALSQMTERLNQWHRQRARSKPSTSSDTTEMTAVLTDPAAAIATLPAELRDGDRLSPLLTSASLAEPVFDAADARAIAQAVWLRDIGGWARGDASSLADQAAALFDWTVRNIELVDDRSESPHAVWELLLHGRGTAAQRAWVFCELCRQQRLNAVVLQTPTQDGADRVLVGCLGENRVYVFDPALGLPLPGADGASIATLDALAADDRLSRALDSPGEPYPHSAADFAAAKPAIVADRFALTERVATLDAALTGADRLALAVDVAAESRRMAETAPDRGQTLWDFPYRSLEAKLAAGPATRRREVKRFLPYAWRPRLWKARALHFRGRLAEADKTRDALADDVDDHRAAQQLYMNPSVRPNKRQLAGVASEVKREIYRAAKNDATLWSGVLAYERGDYANAIGWLEPALDASGFKTHRGAVRYNLARAQEAAGDFARAAELLETDDSPQRAGNRIRARRLRELAAAGAQAEAE